MGDVVGGWLARANDDNEKFRIIFKQDQLFGGALLDNWGGVTAAVSRNNGVLKKGKVAI